MIHFNAKRKDQIVIGIPSKGRIKELVLAFLQEKGCIVEPPKGRQLQSTLKGDPSCHVVFLHARDVAVMLHEKIIDVGFTGLDLIADTNANVRPVVRLNCGKVKMALMVPSTSPHYHPFHLLHKSVATPYPNLTKAYFERLKVETNVRAIQGASEGIPYLGIVEATVDVIESGASAAENGLKIIVDDIFDSECIAAVNQPELQPNYSLINKFLRKLYS